MFERFTDRSRRAVVLAQEEAREAKHNYIGTEHLLLGMLHEGEGLAAEALSSVGLTLERARAAVEEMIGHGTEHPKGHIPFTPRAKKVLELALRMALRLEHKDIRTEHLLLGLLEEGEGVAAQVLERNVDGGLQRVIDEVYGLLAVQGSLTSERRERIRQTLSERSTRSLTLGGHTELFVEHAVTLIGNNLEVGQHVVPTNELPIRSHLKPEAFLGRLQPRHACTFQARLHCPERS
jgi:ATP-dependent Clp protease ATP-binding subunit ClpC